MNRFLGASAVRFVLALGFAVSCGGRENVTPDAGSAGGTSGARGADASADGDDGSGKGGGGSNSGGASGSGGASATSGAGPAGGAAGAIGGAGGGGAGGGGAGSSGAAGAAGAGGGLDASDSADTSAPTDAPRDRSIPDGCTPSTCSPIGANYCGIICDGCGNELDCGSCSAGQVCGARVPGLCGTPCPLCTQIPRCETGMTTVSGTVVTAALGAGDPVYGATVFIPNLAPGGKLPPLPAGPSCARCAPLLQEDVLASAVTGPDGAFTLWNVPAGTAIPLVVQVGRWRYETAINVTPCIANPLPLGTARLPRTQSEGNLPLTAISTGDVDALECVLRKMGVADSEFSNPGGAGRIHFYRNNGAVYDSATPSQTALVDTPAVWDRYDQILFACEGVETQETAPALKNLVDYTNKGGRVLATHFAYTWLYQNAGFAMVGAWQVNQTPPSNPFIANIDTSTVGGQGFASWLRLAGALSNANPPQVAINDVGRSLNAVPSASGGQRIIYSENPPSVQEMIVPTPINASPDQTCGRVIYTDFHLPNAMNGALTFPAECIGNALTPQEKLLEFALLRLASCEMGPPPPVPPPPPPPKLPPCN